MECPLAWHGTWGAVYMVENLPCQRLLNQTRKHRHVEGYLLICMDLSKGRPKQASAMADRLAGCFRSPGRAIGGAQKATPISTCAQSEWSDTR